MSSPITTIADIGKHDGQTVTIRGWLYNLRESGKLLFPIFRDGTGHIQGVVPKSAVPPEVFEAVKGLTQESSVIVEGKVRADKRAPGGYELDVSNVQVLQRVAESDPYPITPKSTAWISSWSTAISGYARRGRLPSCAYGRRSSKRCAIFLTTMVLCSPIRPFSRPAACEGTSTLFPVDYFDEQAYLTQSGQLYIEATAMALGKVYSFGPTFRAEKSKTRRHLTEFWMVEPEVAYATLDDLMDLAEGLISFVVKRCLESGAAICRSLAAMWRSSRKSQLPSRVSPTTKRCRCCRKGTPKARWKPSLSGAEISARPTKLIFPRNSTSR